MLIGTVNLIKNLIRVGIIVLFVAVSIIESEAQLNSEIGYTLSYTSAPKTNIIIDRYNEGSELLTEMKKFHYISGFNAGVSYRINLLKFVLAWESLSASKIGGKGSVEENRIIEKQLFFNFNAISAGAEVIIDHIGIGGSFDYNMNTFKTKVSGATSKIKLLRETYYSNKLYLIFYFKATDRLGVVLKPYVKFPWSYFSVKPLANYLEVIDNSSFLNEKYIQIGLTFNILNGKQP